MMEDPKQAFCDSFMERGPFIGHCIRCGKYDHGHPVKAKISWWRRFWRGLWMMDGCFDIMCWPCCKETGIYQLSGPKGS